MTEGKMGGSDNASFRSVRRSRRPHGTPRNFMHENRETSETPAVLADSRSAGEGSGRTARMYVSEESHRGIVPMNHSNKDRASSAESEEGRLRLQENTLSSDTYPTQCGTARVPRVRECARSEMLGRHSPARRTGCANERPSGSVRGAPGNWCPYRDLIILSRRVIALLT